LLKQAAHPFDVLRDTRIELAVRALEIRIGDDPRAAMTWACDIDDIQVTFAYEPIEVHVHEVQPRRRSPMAEESWLHVVQRERLTQ